jgi:hypothetical protein
MSPHSHVRSTVAAIVDIGQWRTRTAADICDAPKRPLGLPPRTGNPSIEDDDLSYRSHFIDPVLFVRWEGTTDEADFDRLVRTILDARGEGSRKIVYIGIIPRGNALPDMRARGRIARAIDEVWEHCASIHMVIEGEGMRRALVRSVIAGLLLVLARRRHRFAVHVDVAAALGEAAKTASFDAREVLANARRLGALDDAPPCGGP